MQEACSSTYTRCQMLKFIIIYSFTVTGIVEVRLKLSNVGSSIRLHTNLVTLYFRTRETTLTQMCHLHHILLSSLCHFTVNWISLGFLGCCRHLWVLENALGMIFIHVFNSCVPRALSCLFIRCTYLKLLLCLMSNATFLK